MTQRACILALVAASIACGSTSPEASSAAPTEGSGGETERSGPASALEPPIDPARRLESLSANERHALAEWLHARLPPHEVVCADGRPARAGLALGASDDDAAPPPDPSAPAACRGLTVGDHVGCQVAAGAVDPCDQAAAMALWAPAAPCGAFAACIAAALAAH